VVATRDGQQEEEKADKPKEMTGWLKKKPGELDIKEIQKLH